MTHDDFITLLRHPESVNVDSISDLKEMVERYPYFVQARLLYVKALQESHSIHYSSNLRTASVYSPSRRWFYYFVHPEKMLSTEPYQRNNSGKSSGDYFDMINIIESEGGDARQSLKNLAERLKSARSMVMNPKVPLANKPTIRNDEPVEKTEMEKENPTTDKISTESMGTVSTDYFFTPEQEISEANAKKLIKERKYSEAIEILRALNLNNPKKSVYFADQIRFLEKVIVNSKK